MTRPRMRSSESEARQTGHLDALIIGAGFSGLYQLHCLRDRLGLAVTMLGSGRRRRRHLVLEPLPGCALRFGKPLLLLHLFRGVAAGMGVVGALSRAARDHALSEPRRRQVRLEARHSLRHPGYGRALRSGGQPLARYDGDGRALDREVPHYGGGLPLHRERAENSWPGKLRRTLGPHRAMAA